MWFIGIDAHKVKCSLTAKDESGKLTKRATFPHTREGWTKAFEQVPRESKVAIECVGWYQPIFDLLEELGMKPVLVHARDVAMIAKSRKKTDKRDSETLCDLLRTDYLPTAHVPSKPTRELRELTRHHEKLVKRLIETKNRIHRLLERAWIELPDVTDLFGQQGRAWLKTANVSSAQRVVLETLVEDLEHTQKLQTKISREIAKRVQDDADVGLLITINGIGVMGAAALKAEIDTVERFPNRSKFRANFGMNPSVRDSADTQQRGRMTKQGPGIVRKVVVQGAHHYTRHDERAKAKSDRIANKRGKGRARAAAGSDLLNVAYQMLKTRTTYKFARASEVKRKQTELARLAATA